MLLLTSHRLLQKSRRRRLRRCESFFLFFVVKRCESFHYYGFSLKFVPILLQIDEVVYIKGLLLESRNA